MQVSGTGRQTIAIAAVVAVSLASSNVSGQESNDERGPASSAASVAQEPVEEVVVVGSHISGASITGVMPVTVVNAEKIETLGVSSQDELLQYLPEMGQNFFSELDNNNIETVRGDAGSFNLRNLGTGYTLVLFNGRRMVNSAAYQNVNIGGSFVPVNSVNSQTIPVLGLQRVEVLRDGASAIYGADAVAGVINYVTKTDLDGFSVQARYASYEDIPRDDYMASLEWGENFNDGRTNFSVFSSFYQRDRVSTLDDPKWADADYRRLVPQGSPWFGSNSFRNTHEMSEYGQFDVVGDVAALGLTGTIWDADGEFHVYPAGHARCQWNIGPNTCGAVDGGDLVRYNTNEHLDLLSELDRINVLATLNHEFPNGIESFTELSAYFSETKSKDTPNNISSTVAPHRVGPQNYYNPFGPCGSPNRLPDSVIGTQVPCEGLELIIDSYYPTTVDRTLNNEGEMFRAVQGFRGTHGDWHWESALTWSRATATDLESPGRISNTRFEAALNDPTPNAYNPFRGGIDTNVEPLVIDALRYNETELKMVDAKVSRNELFELPGGPASILVGLEYREESYLEDFGPELDGTIRYTDHNGVTHPIVSDVVGSSPQLDREGSRRVFSAYSEMQAPLFNDFDLHAAIRMEDFSDIDESALVGKLGFGWRVFEPLLIRGSWSQGFSAPNLVTVDPTQIVRRNTIVDYVCLQADPTEATLNCEYGIVRTARGSTEIKPETSTSISIGLVFDPLDYLTLTLDFWEIETEDRVGLFGRNIETGKDLLLRLGAGNSNCANVAGNPSVDRNDPSTLEPNEAALYEAAGLCPVGQVTAINEVYTNLDTLNIRGLDVGVYFDYDTAIGTFGLSYQGSFLDKYTQTPSGGAKLLLDAIAAGTVPPSIPVPGFADILRQDGNPAEKQTIQLTWGKGNWGTSITGKRDGEIYQSGLTLSDGTKYVIPAMTILNASIDYRFSVFNDVTARFRVGALNVTDERAPLADDTFGFFSGIYDDFGRSFFVDLRVDL